MARAARTKARTRNPAQAGPAPRRLSAPRPGEKGHERQLVGPIVQTICDRIASRVISPGNRLSEHEICEEFGVSRSSARDVLTALQQRGLVVRPPNRSAIVAKFTADEIYEAFNVREVLEGLCFRLATENEPPQSWQDLVDLYAGPMEDIVRRGDFAAQLKNIEFLNHRVRTASRNRTLCDMLESIDVRSRTIITRTLMLRGRLEQGLHDLRAIVAAMRRGDAAEAERLRRLNIIGQKEFFRQHESVLLN